MRKNKKIAILIGSYIKYSSVYANKNLAKWKCGVGRRTPLDNAFPDSVCFFNTLVLMPGEEDSRGKEVKPLGAFFPTTRYFELTASLVPFYKDNDHR